jgi:hypothetical protein
MKKYKRHSSNFKTPKIKKTRRHIGANKTIKGEAVPKHRRRKDKKSESNINSAAHNQTLKQQKQLNGSNHRIPINIYTEC